MMMGLVGTLLTLACIGWLWWRGSRQTPGQELRREQINREALREALDEVEQRRLSGELDDDAAQALVDDIARRATHEAQSGASQTQAPPTSVPVGIGLRAVIVLVLAGTATGYAAGGSWRVAERVELARRHPELVPALELEHLREYVVSHPRDVGAWGALGEREFAAGRYEAAARAFAEANGRAASPSPDLLVAEGEALAMLNGRDLSGRPAERFMQALALDAEHPRALWFLALHAMQAGHTDEALGYWRRMAAIESMPPQVREVIEQQIARIEGQAPAEAAPVSASSDTLQLTVEHPDGAIQADGVLFVFARPAGQRSGPPLAVKRIARPRFPVQLSLGDADAMIPGRKLSAHDAWTITARLSASGSVERSSGDLLAERDIAAAEGDNRHHLVLQRP